METGKTEPALDTPVSDNQLALMAGKGDRDAFGQLLERHYDGVFRLAWRLCGHREEAEDVTQEICISLASAIRGFRGDAQFRTWLYRIVVNRVNDARRRNITMQRYHADFGEVEALRRADGEEEARMLHWLAGLMTQLPQGLRETAALVVGEQMNHGDAAQVLGVSEGTVSWRMSEVKKQLRNLAEEEA